MADSPSSSHPDLPRLVAFAFGQLTPAEHAIVGAHVDQCPRCELALANLASGPESPHLPDTIAQVNGPRPPQQSAVPDELAHHPRYQILRLLGQGNMGAVYQARHKVMDRLVAIKVIHARLVGNATAVERFHREVQAAAKLHHPNIVTAHDADVAGTTHFLVMEFVEGIDLARYLNTRGPLPVAHACHVSRQVALGLQHAHEHGMVHRDIKPANLMLTAGGVVKVMDFGLARLTQEGTGVGAVTGEHVVMGTPDYIAPEQAHDARQADIRADIYSLGCTLYHMLAGRPPFAGGSLIQKLAGHLKGVGSLSELPAPEGLQTVLAKMLATEPAQRYQTPAEVAQALRPFIQPVPAPSMPSPAGEARTVPGDPALAEGSPRRVRQAKDRTPAARTRRSGRGHPAVSGPEHGTYRAEISRVNPCCFLFLVDQSASMAQPFAGQPGKSKAQGVADSLNRLLQNLILKCAKTSSVHDYFHIGVIGYGGQVTPAFGGSLAGRPLVAVSDLAHLPLRVEHRRRKVNDAAGNLVEEDFKFPVWFEAASDGKTPMCAALTLARQTVADFIDRFPACYPPLVLNFTDGMATDGNPEPPALALRDLASSDGNVLLFNAHTSSRPGPSIEFPEREEAVQDAFARLLFRMSSPLPERLLAAARTEGLRVNAGARGFVFNADLLIVSRFMDIGTKVSPGRR
jgi:serine/threonine protein kinase